MIQAKEEQETFRNKKSKSDSKANAPNDFKYRDDTGQYSDLDKFYKVLWGDKVMDFAMGFLVGFIFVILIACWWESDNNDR